MSRRNIRENKVFMNLLEIEMPKLEFPYVSPDAESRLIILFCRAKSGNLYFKPL